MSVKFEILYSRSTDGGASFDPAINLNNNLGTSLNPSVAATGNNVYVVWYDNSSGNNEILYARSTDSGANFDPTFNLSNNAGLSALPSVATSGNNVHVIWQDNTPGNSEILFTRSTDGGDNFDPAVNLSNNVGLSDSPSVAASGNNVYVVWHDDSSGNFETLYTRSTDGGASFDPTVNLSNNSGACIDPPCRPVITALGNYVYTAWADDTPGNFEILYRKSVDSGSTFEDITIDISNNAGVSLSPAMAYYDTQL